MKYHSYYILTIGCQMNKSDSEKISSYLNSFGLQEKKAKEADIVIINTCGIRQKAEDRVYTLVRNFKKNNPNCRLIVTGCLARRSDVQKRIAHQVDLFMPINNLPDLMPVLESKEKAINNLIFLDESVDTLRSKQGEKYLEIESNHKSNFIAIVPIGNGCNNFCSYCVVPYARGREVYRPYNKIISEVKSLIKTGYKEINLIAQNVNSYFSGDKDFSDLLLSIDNLKGDFIIRFSSSHPKDVSDKLIKVIAKTNKLVNHFHLALQSGDNEILQKMNRKYTAEHYLQLIDKIRRAKPDMAISTDVIVGFPSETREQFKNTVSVFEKISFDLAYISRYSPRPFTAAYSLKDDVSLDEKKRREDVLSELLAKTAYKNNYRYLNNIVRVLVESRGSGAKYFGKTSSYKNVSFLSKDKNIIGKFVMIKIINVHSFGLEGEFIEIDE